MEDLIAGSSSRWAFCQFRTGYGFPGRCGPSYRTYYQSSEFLPTCHSSINSYRDEVYWLLYDPLLPGEKYAPEWLPSDTTASGIPLFLMLEEGAHLEHVSFSKGGYGGDFSLNLNRPSSTTHKSISVLDGLGNGVSIKGGSFTFENLRIESDISSSGSGVQISENTDVAMNGLFISTVHNGNAIYSIRSGRLSFTNIEIRPRYSYQRGFYIQYADTVEIDNLVFIHMSDFQHYQSIYSVYLAKNASITNSYIDCSKLRYTNGIDFVNSYDASIEVKNVTLFSDTSASYLYNLLRILRAGDVTFHDNTIIGVQTVYNGYSTVDVQQVDHFEAVNNVVTNVASRGHVWDVNAANSLVLSNNVFVGCEIVAQQEYAFVSIDSPSIGVQDNNFESLLGYAIIQLGSSVDAVNFTRNAIIDPTILFYVKTTLQYDATADGNGIFIGPNYWNTTSFQELNRGAYDSTYDSDLATIAFESLFIDREMIQTILAPPSQAILDEVEKTISGTIAEELLVVVPAGLYYAPGSIILRHPKAELVLEAGVRVMFAPYASIRVDQGVLKVLGDLDNPVLLAPIEGLAAEYGDASIESDTVFDGIYFGPGSNGTVLGGGNTYVDGSIIRHCTVQFGGYFENIASIYFDRVSVALDQVSILGKWDRSVHGIYFNRPVGPVFLCGVNVTNAGNYGVYVYYPASETYIVDAVIQGSRNYGLYMYYSKETRILRSSFHENDESNYYSRQVYSNGGKRAVEIFFIVL